MQPANAGSTRRHIADSFIRHHQSTERNKHGLQPLSSCTQQPEGYECGYYVMKWMYNIILYYSKGKEEDFEKIMADSSMSFDDINETKEVWASKCIANM
ncbi:hypothetical protein vseg_013307 [Gypsophila vaccaria]